MKLIASGATADVYVDDKNRLVKLFKDTFPKEAVEKEANNQRILYETGLPVPKIFEKTEIGGRNAIIMEYFAGKSLGEKLLQTKNYVNGITIEENTPEKMDDMTPYLNSVIDLQIRVNSVKLNEFPSMKEKLIRQLNKAQGLDEYAKNKIISIADGITYKNDLCHGDFHPFNLIETNEGIKIIDWADATIGNAEADIYRTYMIYELNLPEIAKKYLTIYCDKTSKNKEEILTYEPVIMAARLSEKIMEKEKHEIMDRLKKYITS